MIRIRQSEPKANGTEVPPHSDDYIVGASVEEICGSGNAADFEGFDWLEIHFVRSLRISVNS